MAATGKEYKLLIKIEGEVTDSLTASTAKANAALKSLGKNAELSGLTQTVATMDKDFTKLDSIYSHITKTGKAVAAAIGRIAIAGASATAAAAAASFSVGNEFETAFAGVKKTVEATEEEYEVLKEDILAMSREIPYSAADISGAMEIAGQLGIATDALTDFTEVMMKIGGTTNLSAETAATELARFANITQMPDVDENGVSNWERIGATIVDLGNNFATTEEEIVTMATKLAATGSLVGASEDQLLALATAMSSVGLAANVGGSTMSKLLKKIQLAVETDSDAVADFAKVSGLSSKEFKKAFAEDAVRTTALFIDGLTDVERNGKSAVAVVDEMGLSEIRLSNMILALAGADTLLTDALDTAEKSWEENTALEIEFGKRAETIESQLTVLKNAFKEVGTRSYYEFREPVVDAISDISGKVSEVGDFLLSADGVSKWTSTLESMLPTFRRVSSSMGNVAKTVFSALKDVGSFAVKNGDKIVGVFAGIGGALAAYKIESTAVHALNAILSIGKMSGWTQALLGVAGVTGLVTGIAAWAEAAEAWGAEKSAREHFGDITLSLQDLKDAADAIIGVDFSGFYSAIEAYDDLDGMASTLEKTVKDLNKYDWKVSVGLDLEGDDAEEYRQLIDDYIKENEEYVDQLSYAAHLNMTVAMGGEGGNASLMVDRLYGEASAEMQRLGTELSDTVNEAFADGVLSASEISKIANIRQKMADLQAQYAKDESAATLARLELDYLGTGLTGASFKELINTLSETSSGEIDAAADVFEAAYADVQKLKSEGYYDRMPEAYEADLQSIKSTYLEAQKAPIVNSAQFMASTLESAYPELLSNIREMNLQLPDIVSQTIEIASQRPEEAADAYEKASEELKRILYSDLAPNDQSSLTEMFEAMQPTLESLESLVEKYEAIGDEAPQEVVDAINEILAIGAAGGDLDAIWTILTDGTTESEEYLEALETAREAGAVLPQAIVEAITSEESTKEVYDSAKKVLATIEDALSTGVTATVPLNLNYQFAIPVAGTKSVSIGERASGGLATSPELTWFAEDGPEMAIPINSSSRARDLWLKTGQLLGLKGSLDGINLTEKAASTTAGSTQTIEYNPVLQFYGEAPSKNDLTDALKISQDEFETMMQKYLKNHSRVAFA